MADKYFKILELNSNATLKELESAYKNLITVWHPDRFQKNEELRKKAEIKTRELNEAFNELKAHIKAEKYFSQKKDTSYFDKNQENEQRSNKGRYRESAYTQERRPRDESKIKTKKFRPEKKQSKLKYLYFFIFSFVLSMAFFKIFKKASDDLVFKEEKAIIEVTDGDQIVELNVGERFEIVRVSSERVSKNEFIKSVLACDKKKVSRLLAKGQAVNQIDAKGNTALTWAVRRGCLDVIKLLISKNADVNLESSNGFSPLMWANLYKRKNIKKVLVKAGAKDMPKYWNK